MPDITLSGRQVAALTTLFLQVLLRPDRVAEIVSDPEESLVELGMTEEEIQGISEYVDHVRTLAGEAMETEFDTW